MPYTMLQMINWQVRNGKTHDFGRVQAGERKAAAAETQCTITARSEYLESGRFVTTFERTRNGTSARASTKSKPCEGTDCKVCRTFLGESSMSVAVNSFTSWAGVFINDIEREHPSFATGSVPA